MKISLSGLIGCFRGWPWTGDPHLQSWMILYLLVDGLRGTNFKLLESTEMFTSRSYKSEKKIVGSLSPVNTKDYIRSERDFH